MPAPTATEFAAWHQRYDMLYSIVVEDATAYLHAPTQQALLNAVERYRDEPMGLLVHLLHSCWLGGDLSLKVDDNGQETPLFMAVMKAMMLHAEEWTNILFAS